jgi:hypothetical protein
LPNPIDSPTREKSPCFGCKEKFTACHDNCPKDKRGEGGYEAWKKHLEMLKDARKEYERSRFNKYPR